jgi:hypothetical protein
MKDYGDWRDAEKEDASIYFNPINLFTFLESILAGFRLEF